MLDRLDIEEADVKIILHIAHCSIEKNDKIYLLSSDTDVLVLAVNYWRTFSDYGLQVMQLQISSIKIIRRFIKIAFSFQGIMGACWS